MQTVEALKVFVDGADDVIVEGEGVSGGNGVGCL